MIRKSFERDNSFYSFILRSKKNGEDSSDRRDVAERELNERLAAIKRKKEHQLYWVIAGYVLGLVADNMLGVGLFVAVFMNLAAFHYGKYCYYDSHEMAAFSKAIREWEAEGKPSY